MLSPICSLIYETIYSLNNTENILPRNFLTMEWYLMDMVDNYVRFHVNHIDYRDASLMIYFSQIKINQEGVDWSSP